MSYYDKDRSGNAGRMHSWAKPSLGGVAQYQISGMPAMDSIKSETVTFTRVTRAVTVWANGAGATISFGDTAQGTVILPQNSPVRLEVMTTSITESGDETVYFIAELTGIEADQKPDFDNTTNEVYTIA